MNMFRGLGLVGGIQIIRSEFCTLHTHDEIDVIPISKHRSKRVWKKLRQRRMRNARKIETPQCYQMGNKLVMHPAIEAQLARELGRQAAISLNNMIVGAPYADLP